MNLFKLFGEIAVKNDEANKNIDETKKKAENAGKDVSKACSDMGSAAVKVGKTIATGLAAAAAAMGALIAAAESSREYRTEMGKLDTAFEASNHSAEAAKATYKELQSVLGETDQAVEAANHLAKLCTTEEELAAWTEICTGVYGSFGASLPIEGLTEAANETARCGQLTGPLTDAINWAAKAGETFGVTLKENTKANKEWNDAVKNAASAEDYFNLALQECATEQERQALIMNTLNGLYSDAAKKYKATNAEIIEANKATERMNELWAKVGKKVEPIVTTFKNGVVDLGEALIDMVSDADVEEFCDTMKDGFEFLAEDVLPKLIDGLTWVFEKIELIAFIAISAGTAFLTYKAVVLAVTIAHGGLTAALEASTIAQAALNAVQNATPLGILVTLIAGATTALVALCGTTDDAAASTRYLTDEERKLIESAEEAAEAFRDQQKATAEAANGIMSQMDHVTSLADELMALADSSGYVEEKDRSRVEFILGQLNQALGTEYEMIDGVIQQYDKLTESIYESIKAETARLLLQNAEKDYTQAIKDRAAALDRVLTAENGVNTQRKNAQAAYEKYIAAQQKYQDTLEHGSKRLQELHKAEMEGYKGVWEVEEGLIDDAIAKREEAAVEYQNYASEVMKYEDAMQASKEGNYEKAIELLTQSGQAYTEYADTVDEETKRTLNTLEKAAIDAGLAAETAKANFAAGIDGFGAETVAEAEEAYKKALAAFETAHNDAFGVGADIMGGLGDGLTSNSGAAIQKIVNIVNSLMSAGYKTAENYSPSAYQASDDAGSMSYGEWLKRNGVNGSHSSGLDYVPFDGYVAELHKGEMVVPAESAEFIRAGGGNGAVVQMLARILSAIEENGLANVSLTVGNREFGRLVREVL